MSFILFLHFFAKLVLSFYLGKQRMKGKLFVKFYYLQAILRLFSTLYIYTGILRRLLLMVMSVNYNIKSSDLTAQKHNAITSTYDEKLIFKISSDLKLDSAELNTSLSGNNIIFKARDNNEYDIEKILHTRLANASDKLIEKKRNLKWYEKIWDWCKDLFNSKTSSKALWQEFLHCEELFTQKLPINILFEELCGEKYNVLNIEKFLKGKIKLKIETSFEKFIGKEIKTENTSVPEVKGRYFVKGINKENAELNKEDEIKYNELMENLDDNYKHKLSGILYRGILLNTSSDDQSSTLDNLYNILTKKRAQGLDNINLLKECIDVLDNPSLITQRGEDIPEEYKNKAVDKITKNSKDQAVRKEAEENLQNRFYGTCAAAAIEYNLAAKKPAEFIRVIEQMSSTDKKVSKAFEIDKKSDEYRKILENLKIFQIPYIQKEQGIEIFLNPDKNAFFLAQIQNNHKDPDERSMIDILMQSMITNAVSRNTYDSLLDKRYFGPDSGLTFDEINFMNSILQEENSKNSIYMSLAGNSEILSNDTINKRKDIEKTLSENKNIITGYVFSDEKNNKNYVSGGHEIMIVGEITNLLGEEFFVCQDSDDDYSEPICIPKKELLRNIHHTVA